MLEGGSDLRTNESWNKSKREGVKNKGEGIGSERERKTQKLRRKKQKRGELGEYRKDGLRRRNSGLNVLGLFIFFRMKVSRK